MSVSSRKQTVPRDKGAVLLWRQYSCSAGLEEGVGVDNVKLPDRCDFRSCVGLWRDSVITSDA